METCRPAINFDDGYFVNAFLFSLLKGLRSEFWDKRGVSKGKFYAMLRNFGQIRTTFAKCDPICGRSLAHARPQLAMASRATDRRGVRKKERERGSDELRGERARVGSRSISHTPGPRPSVSRESDLEGPRHDVLRIAAQNIV